MIKKISNCQKMVMIFRAFVNYRWMNENLQFRSNFRKKNFYQWAN
jgi:hypothetical protein